MTHYWPPPFLIRLVGEYRIHNADITFRCDATADQLIDVIEGNRVYVPALYVLNKIDQISIEVCAFRLR
jgi:ribosome-interacting GTPase 1